MNLINKRFVLQYSEVTYERCKMLEISLLQLVLIEYVLNENIKRTCVGL